MIDRRIFLRTAAGGLLAIPIVALAQQREKLARIGLLDYSASDPVAAARWKAFRERLREAVTLPEPTAVSADAGRRARSAARRAG